MKADAILMHKQKNVIALRAQTGENTVIQVRDLNLFLYLQKYLKTLKILILKNRYLT
jgi:hypothetical protein